MAKSFQDQADIGSFITTTTILDPSLEDLKGESLSQFVVQLSSVINKIALSLNIKDSGYYVQQEFVCGQAYFANPALDVASPPSGQNPTLRQVFRRVVNFGQLPNTGTTSVAHDIDILAANGGINYVGFTFTRIYGAASDTTNRDYIPVPYVAGLNGTAVSIDVDATNVSITTTDDKTAFDTCYVVLEYLKE